MLNMNAKIKVGNILRTNIMEILFISQVEKIVSVTQFLIKIFMPLKRGCAKTLLQIVLEESR